MLGARPISAMLAAMTLFEVCMLLALPPQGGRLPVEIHWAWGLYASALVSLVGAILGMRFGGPLPPLASEPPSSETSPKRVLH